MPQQEMTTFQKIVLTFGVVFTGIVGSSSGWLILSVIEIDRTQEAVLQRLAMLEGARLECNQRVQNLHDMLDGKTRDRFTGRQGDELRERIEREIADADARNGVQHTFIWSRLNEIERQIEKMHDALWLNDAQD